VGEEVLLIVVGSAGLVWFLGGAIVLRLREFVGRGGGLVPIRNRTLVPRDRGRGEFIVDGVVVPCCREIPSSVGGGISCMQMPCPMRWMCAIGRMGMRKGRVGGVACSLGIGGRQGERMRKWLVCS
jgi:hypothetical protein